MKYPEKYLLKMVAGTLGRITAVSDNRAEFVRAAIEVALGGVVSVEPIVPSAVKKNSIAGLSADQVAILDFIRGRVVSARDVERHFGWLGLRYSKAERGLVSSGRVAFQNGLLIHVDGEQE